MSKSKPPLVLKKKKNNADLSDSDTSLDKYYQNDDLISSSSSSSTTTSKSSPIASLEPRKMFLKKPATKKDEFQFGDEVKLTSSDDHDPLKPALRRPLNPLAKPDIHLSVVGDSLGSTMPEKKDGTPMSTMKLGSDTLDEEQEKEEFFRNFERVDGENRYDYGALHQEIELDLSPTRNDTEVIKSFDKQINQMSTPLHHQPNDDFVKESLSNELDREMEHDKQKLNTTTTIKHVTIVEPPARPSASVDEFSRATKTASEFLTTATTTTGDSTRDLNMLHNAYKQNIVSMPTTRASRTHTFDPKKKIQQKPIATKNLLKPIIQTPTKKKSSPSAVVTRPKTAPAPTPKETENKDSALIEQLKLDKELLLSKIESLEKTHDEQARQIRQENYKLQAKVTQLTNSDGKSEMVPPKQREVHELEKMIDGFQSENEKLYKQIKQIEQQHKQVEQSMFDENDKLRRELTQTKLLFEQQQNSHAGNVKKQSSTIVLTNLVSNEHEKSDHSNENQRLKNEIIVLKNKLSSTSKKEHQSEDEETLRLLDQGRIRDLERQVKELELINRRRQQNSTTQVGLALNPLEDRNQLEIKLQKAEEVVRDRQISEEKLSHELQILEEKYTLMKQMYTKNGSQSTMNDQFERQLQDMLSKNKTLTGQSQLRRENERLKNELEKLKTQQTPKPAKSLKRDLETIKLLRTDLERKNDELEKLRALYDAVTVQHKSLLADREREKTRLAIMGNKPYQPDRFTQVLSSTEEVHAENAQLKHLIEKLEHDSQQQHAELMHLRNDRQAAISLALREKDDELLRIRQQHKQELQTIINEMSANTTETRVSDLLRKIESQEASIAHLKKSNERADENARELAILRVQDDELKATNHRLEQELANAQTYHTPEMKHFQELQSKITQLEQRWHNRDKITKDYTTSLIKQHDLDSNQDVSKLRAIIKQKNQEIERFHLELDSMLELLKTLKFQQLIYHQ